MLIAQKACDFIVRQEVTSQAYYERHYRHPEWPGGASGITIAVGYDLGYATTKKIADDWSHLVPYEMLQAMIACAGVKGDAARALLPRVKAKIDIPWSAAVEVFQGRDIPAWTATVQKAVPNTDKVGALCLGMLVSTAYNRGAGGFNDHTGNDRYRELRAIRQHMGLEDYKPVSGEFRSMVRLWPTMKGLRDRYAETAALWDEGLAHPATGVVGTAEPDPTVPLNAGPARTKPPTTTVTQHATTGAMLLATNGAANAAVAHGFPTSTVVAIAVCGVVIALSVWVAIYRNRNPK